MSLLTKIGSTIKTYLLALLSGLAALLGLWALLERRGKHQAQEEVQDTERENVALRESHTASVEVKQAQTQAKEQAAEHAKQQTPTHNRPTGGFGDSRLQ